jgi:hypothetical protein
MSIWTALIRLSNPVNAALDGELGSDVALPLNFFTALHVVRCNLAGGFQ